MLKINKKIKNNNILQFQSRLRTIIIDIENLTRFLILMVPDTQNRITLNKEPTLKVQSKQGKKKKFFYFEIYA